MLARLGRAGGARAWWVPVVLATAAAAAAGDAPPAGADVFAAHCARCHGAAGETDTPGARALKVRPLAGDAALAAMPLADLVKAIETNPKHRGTAALKGLDAAQLEAAARHVHELARRR